MTNSEIKDPALENLINQPSQLKTWDWFKRNCSAGNKVTVVQTELAQDIGVTNVTVCKGIKRLLELNFIAKNGKHGTSNAYMLNPNYIWVGSLSSLDDGKLEFIKLKNKE